MLENKVNKKSLTESVKTDSKTLWTIVFVIGMVLGNTDRILDYLLPELDQKFVNHQEFDEELKPILKRLENLENSPQIHIQQVPTDKIT